jgi:hypothetical protein
MPRQVTPAAFKDFLDAVGDKLGLRMPWWWQSAGRSEQDWQLHLADRKATAELD